MSIYWPLSFIRIAPYYILGWNGPKERKFALNDVKPLYFSAFLLESRMLQRTQASNRPLWLFSNQWKNWPSPASMSFSSTSHDSSVPWSMFLTRARRTRLPWDFDFFSFTTFTKVDNNLSCSPSASHSYVMWLAEGKNSIFRYKTHHSVKNCPKNTCYSL